MRISLADQQMRNFTKNKLKVQLYKDVDDKDMLKIKDEIISNQEEMIKLLKEKIVILEERVRYLRKLL